MAAVKGGLRVVASTTDCATRDLRVADVGAKLSPETLCREQPMADDANLQGHVATYSQLIGMLKWGGLACFLIAAFVIWLIA
ncbi:hypothetical protein SAMN05192583_1972 [Sphingomonas gellani]|uniref:Aa3 type cytochrome c oxidase subunit IV n=1 Tax=Sphingomonas gellani TaxID=1166340 RepID=A0A1H8DL50_9SPHN|nr:hypothetical protein SAMN05192583_1972 [Sphingomonas gellani]